MIPAKNNIVIKLQDGGEYAIFNPLSGSFDLMDAREYSMLEHLETADAPFKAYLLERGYAYERAADEEAVGEKAYADFRAEIDDTQIQLMLIPTYGCNLACVYCYQNGVSAEHKVITKETVDAFFDYARTNFASHPKKPFITLFGGEPLINSPAQRAAIAYIVDKCADEDYEIAAVTNGYDFVEFVDILKKARVKEIQFTLDGSRDVHDRRRATANHKGTFDRVIEGMDAAVRAGFPVNLRTVVDLENLDDLVRLAAFLDNKGWLDLPPTLFKTQIGRNYELFSCYAKPEHLLTQTALWAAYSQMSKRHPILKKFHRPDFYGVRHIVDTGEAYMASFDTCPACKTEWVFDLNGEIYGCTASCGRAEYRLGTFYPTVALNDNIVLPWRNRDVRSIEKCRTCKYDVICGGGCGVVAANKNATDPLTPDCRPIQEILETGINHYADALRAMTEPSDTATEAAPPSHEESCCCKEEKTGCLVCGKPLVYSETAEKKTCQICRRDFETAVVCENGHFICDSCHNGDILERAERFLSASVESDPIKLVKQVFALPGLNMHGPEYHSIVPAILVAAHQNASGVRDIGGITEAIRRGKDVKGGSCGYLGGCGAALGTGIAASIIGKATPMSGDERGRALAASGTALLALSAHGGPRCCKRDAISSIRSFIKNSGYFTGLPDTKYICGQFKKNVDCIGTRCPYYHVSNSR
ncbi:DUF5714 domain-containing protein [Oscillospiraceae bacterium WX1]